MAFRNTGQLSNYMSLASKYPILTWDEERELARRWREEGDASAAERLVLYLSIAVVAFPQLEYPCRIDVEAQRR